MGSMWPQLWALDLSIQLWSQVYLLLHKASLTPPAHRDLTLL